MTNRSGSFIGRVSGLVIQADAPVSGLRPLDRAEPPDVRVRMHGTSGRLSLDETLSTWYVSPYRDERGVPSLTIRSLGSGYLLCYAEGTRFLVSRSGSDVDAWWDEPLTDVDVADYLLGGVVAFIDAEWSIRMTVDLPAPGLKNVTGRASARQSASSTIICKINSRLRRSFWNGAFT